MKERKDPDKGTIEYPVSVNYRKGWGEWEAVREIVQNAIDNGSAAYQINNDSLTITDRGGGITLKNLLIGESTKDGIGSVGKFGEGLKFGLLALVRERKEVEIKTNGLILKPGLKNMFGTETLTIKWRKNPKPIKGTQVTVKNLFHAESYMRRFLSLDLKSNMKERILMDLYNAGKLYVKGIYVKDIESDMGYNLNMERENPMSGDIDTSKAEDRIANLLMETNDSEVMKRTILTYEEDKSRNIEFTVGTYLVWRMKHPVKWKKEATKIFGTSCLCRATDNDATQQAIYKGFKVLHSSSPFFEGFIKRDVEAVPEEKSKSKNVGMASLEPEAAGNVRWSRRLIESAMNEKIKRIEIVEFGADESNRHSLGMALFNRWIKLSPEVCDSRERCLEVMLHEAVHYYYGSMDVTESFINNLAELSQKVILLTIKGKYRKTPTKTKKSAVNHEAVRNEWSAYYVGDCFDGDHEIFGELESILAREFTHMTILYSIGKAFGASGYGGKTKSEVIGAVAQAIRDYHK